jgi:multiple sugar transport system substrate-binding protein
MPKEHRGRRGSRRSRSALAVLFVVLGVVTACSSDGDTSSPTVLRVLMTDDWVTPPFVAAVREFERHHPDVRVDVDKGPISDMLDTVAAARSSGDVPDVVQAHAFSAAAQGLAQPVDDLWERHLDDAEFLPGALDDVTWEGRRYGVPLDTNALFLLYDADAFAAAGVAEPQGRITFAQFEEAARSLTTGGRRALAIPSSTWWTYGWIRAAGGDLLRTGDGGVEVTFDDPGTVAALDFLARLVRDGLAYAPSAVDSHSDNALGLFRSGSASTLASGSWDLTTVRRAPDGERFRTTLLPAGPGPGAPGSVMGGSSMFVPEGSRRRALAFDFMAHLISDEYALRLVKEEGRLPVRHRLYDDPYFDQPELAAVTEQLKTATPMKLTAFPEVHDLFENAVDRVLRDDEPAAAVLAEAQQRARVLMPR